MVELRFSITLVYDNITSRKREFMKKGKHGRKAESFINPFRCMELEMSVIHSRKNIRLIGREKLGMLQIK